MASSKEFLTFVLDQLSDLCGITHRMMMGEYMIYYKGKITAYICDDRLLIKVVPSSVKMMPDATYEAPYDGAKDMILCDRVDDREFLKTLFEAMYDELPTPKKRG